MKELLRKIEEGLLKLLAPSGNVSRSELKAIMDIVVEYSNKVC
ncbi:hypothetical protein [Candidatus Methanodesulfokora washburnensis]|jgi:predicted ATP-dependent Lon-type protease|nr:hypothetical protein [Candidatus Methanodesulfokores washburnensis]